jgi:predicted nucleic acid-binding protein
MNVVDSSGWIEYFAGGPNADAFIDVILDFDQLLVSTINIYEVVRRMSLHYGADEKTKLLQNLAIMRRGRMVVVDEQIAFDAAQLAVSYKLPMADSLILATAFVHHATLWTQDAHFAGIPGVKYIPKP